jgi:ABC-type branched-subunit amino acid transport system permease subunit
VIGGPAVLGVASFGADALTHGVILGLVYGVLAAGLVLVYRASGVVNFAHGEAGALGAAVLAKLVLDEHWSFVLALPVVLALGGIIGALSEVCIARRLVNRPRLALLVATIGLSQVLLVAQLLLPKINEVAAYPTPVHRQLSIGSVTLNGPDFVAIAVVPAIVVGLAIWLLRTPSGRALRAASDNPDAARLAGIRPHRVALMAWVLAGVVSTATAIVANPLQGVTVGQQTQSVGVGLLVRALVAALVGRLQSLSLAIAGGVAVGVLQAVADSGHMSQSAVDLVLLLAALGLVLARPSERSARTKPGEGELVAAAPPHRGRIPVSNLAVGLVVGAAALPIVAGRASELFSLSRVVLYAVVGVSVVILTGWAGQLSLGQFAIVGIGTFAAAAFEAHGLPFWVGVPLTAAVGAGISLLVGIPALRARGLDLAVTTLALAVACSSWLFTQSWLLGSGGVVVVQPGRLIGIDLRGPLAYYETTVAVLAVALVGAGAVRRGGLGRRLLAVRANERRAAALGVSPTASKLAAFALAGALAGVAGALLAGLRVRSGAADFGPQESLQVVAVAVIGGAGSAEGAVLGAVFVLGVPAIFGDTTVAGLLPSGLGLLLLVLLFPGGLLELVHRAVPARWRRPPVQDETAVAPADRSPPPSSPPPSSPPLSSSLLSSEPESSPLSSDAAEFE